MVNELEKSLDIALLVLGSKKFSRLSNCKMMATRMLQFQLGSISPKVQHSMERMHEFFVTTYTGVGCSMCNAETHALVDPAKKTFAMSEKFCRDMTSSSLHVLLYLHVHYVRFYQLSSKFMAQCDHLGNYNEQGAVPAEAAIKVDEGKEQGLAACREFRNDPTWLASCGAICEDFNFTKIDETFFPHIDAYVAATKFLAERHKAIMDASKPPKPEAKPEGEGKEDEKKEGEAEKKDEAAENKEAGKEERILERIKFHRDARVLEDAAKPADAGDKKSEETTTDQKTGVEGQGADKQAAPEPQIPEATLPKTPEEILEDAKTGEIYLNVPQEPKNLAELKPLYEAKGADPFQDGKMSNLNPEVYKKVKDAVAAELAKTEAGKEGAEGEVEKKTSSTWFAGTALLAKGLLALMAALLVGF